MSIIYLFIKAVITGGGLTTNNGLDNSHKGSPFVIIEAVGNESLTGLDYSHKGQPFCRVEA